MKQAVSAKIKYTPSSGEKNFIIKTILPTDKVLQFEWSKANNWTVELPIEITYKTLAGKDVVHHSNFAQFILDNNEKAYGGKLSLVELVEKELVSSEVVVDKSTAKVLKEQEDKIKELEKLLASKEDSKKAEEKKGKQDEKH